MYNHELKTKFIQEFTSNIGRRNAAVSMFNALQKYEEEWDSDLCTKNSDELQPVLGEIVGFRTNSKKLRMTILREYVKWCVDNEVAGACDGLLQIEELGNEKLKRQMVANPRHLQRYLDVLFEHESEETVDCIYRCFYWLAYGGMKEEDVLDVTDSEVDFVEMVVRHNGIEYPIYREAIKAFRNCVELEQFRYKHPNYSADKVVFKERTFGNRLLRGMSQNQPITTLRVEMSRRQNNPSKRKGIPSTDESLDLKLSYYRVQLSGIFYREYEAERAGMNVDFMGVAARFMEGKTYSLSKCRNLPGAKQRQLAAEYLEDYNRWKDAYSI